MQIANNEIKFNEYRWDVCVSAYKRVYSNTHLPTDLMNFSFRISNNY